MPNENLLSFTFPSLVLMGAAVVAWFIVWGVRWYSARGTLLDIPNERSSHTRPTPRGGGLGIVVVTLLGALVLLPFQFSTLGYIVAGALIAAVSWVDDLRPLSNRIRFGTHLLAALLVMSTGGWIAHISLPVLGSIPIGGWGLPLTIFWLVGMTNIYNFMDGIDGIAGSQAVVAGVGWFLLAADSTPFVATVGLMVAGSSVGFLFHNWAPAKIFMGDVGSAFLGFTFGWVGVVAVQESPLLFMPMFFLLWVFLFDATFTLLRRWRNGENIFTAHRSHLYQRMVIAGQPHARVTLGYAFLALIGLAVSVSPLGYGWGVAILVLCAVGLWGATVWLERRRG